MARAHQLVIEVHHISLSPTELEERRVRLRALLLRGAIRLVRQQLPGEPKTTELDPAEFVQK